MAKSSTSWEGGTSGNPKGRPKKRDALSEILRSYGEKHAFVGGEEVRHKDLLAQRVWELVTTGQVWLQGEALSVKSVTEWVEVVKWLYGYVSPPNAQGEMETEMVVRVVRENTSRPKPALDTPYHPSKVIGQSFPKHEDEG